MLCSHLNRAIHILRRVNRTLERTENAENANQLATSEWLIFLKNVLGLVSVLSEVIRIFS